MWCPYTDQNGIKISKTKNKQKTLRTILRIALVHIRRKTDIVKIIKLQPFSGKWVMDFVDHKNNEAFV